MTGLYFILPTLVVIFVLHLIVRAAAMLLMMTGMDEKKATFQALSAITGTGFTTKESESVVYHPARRMIITWLMILGSAGIITIIVTATSSFITSSGYHIPVNILILIVGIYLIYRIATNRAFIGKWERFVGERIGKSPIFEEGLSEELLHLTEGYGLVRVIIKENFHLEGKTISDLRLPDRRLLVLGIERGEDWISVPRADEVLKEGDKIVVYGSLKVLKTFFKEKENG